VSESRSFTCDITGIPVGFSENDVPEGEDTNLPPEWAEVTVRRIVPNPAHESWSAKRAHLVPMLAQEAMQVLSSRRPPGSPSMTPEEQASVRQDAERTAGLQLGEQPPAHVVEEDTFHIHFNAVSRLGLLGSEFAETYGLPTDVAVVPAEVARGHYPAQQAPQGSLAGAPGGSLAPASAPEPAE